jgi:hypothetical protein
MVHGKVHGDLREGVVGQGGVGRVPVPAGVVVDGLGHAEEEEPHADAAREQHHEPRRVVVLRLVRVLPQLDIGILTAIEKMQKVCVLTDVIARTLPNLLLQTQLR